MATDEIRVDHTKALLIASEVQGIAGSVQAVSCDPLCVRAGESAGEHADALVAVGEQMRAACAAAHELCAEVVRFIYAAAGVYRGADEAAARTLEKGVS